MRLIKGQQFKVKKMRIAVFVFLLSSTLATTVHAQFVHPGVAHEQPKHRIGKRESRGGRTALDERLGEIPRLKFCLA